MTHIQHEVRDAAGSNLNATVTGVDRRTLDAIFRHPLSHNLAWREVVSLFNAIGEAEEEHNGTFMFRAGGEQLSMKGRHNKDLTGPDVMDLRHLLTRAGWSPNAPLSLQDDSASYEPAFIVVIDHAGARVYRIDRSLEAGEKASPDEPLHFHHQLERKAHDKDREETYPADNRFFGQIAAALPPPGEIVLIGHGKGQSNEAAHLSAFLKAHYNDVYRRIVQDLVADLPRMTALELVDLGREALG